MPARRTLDVVTEAAAIGARRGRMLAVTAALTAAEAALSQGDRAGAAALSRFAAKLSDGAFGGAAAQPAGPAQEGG